MGQLCLHKDCYMGQLCLHKDCCMGVTVFNTGDVKTHQHHWVILRGRQLSDNCLVIFGGLNLVDDHWVVDV